MNYTVHPGTTGSLELKSFWCYVDRLSFNMAEDLNLSDASNAPSDTVNKGSNITVHVIFIFLKYVTLSDDFCFCFFFSKCDTWKTGTNPHCDGYAKNLFWEKLRKMAKRKVVLMLMIKCCISLVWVLLRVKVPRKVPVISNKSIFILIIHYKVVALVLGSAYFRGVHV